MGIEHEITQEMHDVINQLGRGQLVSILESYGFACYDAEPTEDLREAVRVNVEDGTIEPSALGE